MSPLRGFIFCMFVVTRGRTPRTTNILPLTGLKRSRFSFRDHFSSYHLLVYRAAWRRDVTVPAGIRYALPSNSCLKSSFWILTPDFCFSFGEVQEWLNWQHWKCCVRGTVPWVRIPPSPPYQWWFSDCGLKKKNLLFDPRSEIRIPQF
jgi:hypothetical protein